MPEQYKRPASKYQPIKWDGEFYQAMGGGPSICYLHFTLSGRDARLVLHRYPPSFNSPWIVTDVYVYNTDTGRFETTSKSSFTPNLSLFEGPNQRLNSVLPPTDYLFGIRNGCCCHYTRGNHEKSQIFTPDINVCNAKEHYIYRGADFTGSLWKPKTITTRRDTKKKSRSSHR